MDIHFKIYTLSAWQYTIIHNSDVMSWEPIFYCKNAKHKTVRITQMQVYTVISFAKLRRNVLYWNKRGTVVNITDQFYPPGLFQLWLN